MKLKIKLMILIKITNLILIISIKRIDMSYEKDSKFSLSMNNTPNWISESSTTIYEYDGVKISIDAFPKQVKNQLNDNKALESEKIKVDVNSTIIDYINTSLKSKSSEEIKRLVLESLIEIILIQLCF